MSRRPARRRRGRSSDREHPVPGPPAVQATRRGPSPGATLERAQRLGHRAEAIVGTVQRDVDLDDLTATENDHYFIDPGDDEVLYSAPGVAAPLPRGLYHHSTDATTADGIVHIWRPNARIVSTQERQRGVTSEEVSEMARGVANIDVSAPDLGDLPTVGIMGKNDCNHFAAVLQSLIAKELEQYAPEDEDPDPYPSVNLDHDEEPALNLGDRMKHVFEGGACSYHAATVVAVDGGDKVTLEAHVSKDIQRPQFHVRQGVADFVEANDTRGGAVESRGLGKKVDMVPLARLMESVVDDDLGRMGRFYGRMLGESPHMTAEIAAGQNLGVTGTPGRRIAQERMRREQVARAARRQQAVHLISTLLNDVRWANEGLGWNLGSGLKVWDWKRERNKLPSGVSDMRAILAGGGGRAQKLRRCRDLALERLDTDRKRSTATTDLYTALSHVNPNDPNIVTLTHELGVAEGHLS